MDETDYDAALDRIWELMYAEEGTPEAKELADLVDLAEIYEDEHYPIGKE
ncbi:MAG TPA: transcriptional regulator [Acidobacteriota bacterium]|nr:transcriptional regulator [Acidobacteriota bacterium]